MQKIDDIWYWDILIINLKNTTIVDNDRFESILSEIINSINRNISNKNSIASYMLYFDHYYKYNKKTKYLDIIYKQCSIIEMEILVNRIRQQLDKKYRIIVDKFYNKYELIILGL